MAKIDKTYHMAVVLSFQRLPSGDDDECGGGGLRVGERKKEIWN